MRLKKKKWSNDDTELTLLALPSMLWYALFCFLPMFGIIIAFKTYRVQAGRSFVYSLLASPNAGFKNFEFILNAVQRRLYRPRHCDSRSARDYDQ